jgi:putative peptidoglycan lipid II flippase
VYWSLFHAYGGIGLVVASNIGILLQTAVLAGMLHRDGLVRLGGLDWMELGRSAAAACAAGGASFAVLRLLPLQHGFRFDTMALTAGTAVWLGVGWAVLLGLGSGLPSEVRRRLGGS